MEINAAGFGSVGHGHVLWLKEFILDALESLKTMLDNKSFMFLRLQDFKSITDYTEY